MSPLFKNKICIFLFYTNCLVCRIGKVQALYWIRVVVFLLFVSLIIKFTRDFFQIIQNESWLLATVTFNLSWGKYENKKSNKINEKC